jgi:hypothetical protein
LGASGASRKNSLFVLDGKALAPVSEGRMYWIEIFKIAGTFAGVVASQTGFFQYLAFSTVNRADFDFRVDVCSKMTVNRVYKQPEFENPNLVKLGSGPIKRLA